MTERSKNASETGVITAGNETAELYCMGCAHVLRVPRHLGAEAFECPACGDETTVLSGADRERVVMECLQQGATEDELPLALSAADAIERLRRRGKVAVEINADGLTVARVIDAARDDLQ